MDTPDLSLLKKGIESEKGLQDEQINSTGYTPKTHRPVYAIEIPVDPSISIGQMIELCELYGCSVYLAGRHSGHFIITTKDLSNFFWLGMNFNNFINKGQHK